MTIKQVQQAFQNATRIDEAVREIQNDLWDRRYELWNGNAPAYRLDVLEPAVALEMLGYHVKHVNSLGVFPGAKSEAAGEIDCKTKVVKVSRRFFLQEQRFTLAHELGHAVCHPDMGRMHRDLPLESSGFARDFREVQANRFASRFLMPEYHVRHQFTLRFLAPVLDLEDDLVTHALSGVGVDTLRGRFNAPRAVSRFVASAEAFNGKRFPSMASLFKVSPTAMAIRLEELGLLSRNH